MASLYDSIPGFKHFDGITEGFYFKPVPEDWAIFISDVRGSTQAISEGRYKEVNMIGAAPIVVTRNAMKNIDFPFVFGGDGDTLLIPNENIEAVKMELSVLKIHAMQNLKLDLRVGMLQEKRLYDEGKIIKTSCKDSIVFF